LRAHLVLIDESGMLMAPLVRRSLAPAGQTPILKQHGLRRDKVSLMAALSLSPVKRRLSLYYRTFPKQHVNNERTVEFLRGLLRLVRGHVIVVWDRGNMHQGLPIRELLRRFPRLELHFLPPYAPELNPVEQLWNHLKYHRFVNHAPLDVSTLNNDVRCHLSQIRCDPARLRAFLAAADLPFG
jgi:transposase